MKVNTLISAALASLLIAGGGSAHAFNPLKSLGDAVDKAVKSGTQSTQQTQQQPAAQQASPTASGPPALSRGKTSQRKVVYEGYSKAMLPIKKLVAGGKAATAIDEMKKLHKNSSSYDLLTHMELGVMSLAANDLKAAQDRFSEAEHEKLAREGRSTVGGFFSGIKDTAVSTITGNDELGEYSGPGFERVLMLNYKSIAYLLEGDRKAYNVTRRAIDLQNIEKKAFDEKIRKAKEEIAEKEKEQKEKGADLNEVGFDAIVKNQYKATESKARKVPSAFVNPFGFYVAGLVQELDSYEDNSLRDNARISYKKALELNPKSSVIKKAVKDMQSPAPQGRRLVHVVVGDGFAPEKKLLKFDLAMGFGEPIDIELPIYEPVRSRVSRVEIQTTGGKRWASLSEVADITALALRHQKDAGPLVQLRMMTTVIRNVIEGQAWNQAQKEAGLFGQLMSKAKGARDEMAHPDMRSWSMLPSRLMAARIFVPKSVSQLKLVAYDSKGRVLSSQVVAIDKNSHNFVYARTIDNTLYTSSNDKMWVAMK
jgi:hypothetical protein